MGTEEQGTVAWLALRELWVDQTSESFRDSQEPPGLELSCCRQPPDGKGCIPQRLLGRPDEALGGGNQGPHQRVAPAGLN